MRLLLAVVVCCVLVTDVTDSDPNDISERSGSHLPLLPPQTSAHVCLDADDSEESWEEEPTNLASLPPPKSTDVESETLGASQLRLFLKSNYQNGELLLSVL